MTHGPIARLWLTFLNTGEQNDTPMQAFEAWLVVVHIPAVIKLSRSDFIINAFKSSMLLKLGFGLFAGCLVSSIWSELPGRSFWDASVILLSTLGATYIASTTTSTGFVSTIFVGLQIPVAVSLWSVGRDWPGAVEKYSGYWLGIYQNRNTLAPIAAVGVLAAFVLLLSTRKRFVSLLFVPVLILVGAVDMWVLIETGSMTNSVGIGVAALGLVLWLFFSGVKRNLSEKTREISRLFACSVVGMLILFVLVISKFATQISSVFARSDGLSGRMVYWHASVEAILSRPIFGWGWNAAWLSSDFQKQFANQNFEFRWSHSFWLEAGLGVGVVAFIIVLSWAVIGVYRSARFSLGHRDQIWTVVFPCFACVLLTMESINWIAHWVFSLLVATFFIADSRKNDALGGEPVGNLSDEAVSVG